MTSSSNQSIPVIAAIAATAAVDPSLEAASRALAWEDRFDEIVADYTVHQRGISFELGAKVTAFEGRRGDVTVRVERGGASHTVRATQACLAAAQQLEAGHDAALALLGLGADPGGFKQRFKDRAAELQRRYIDPLDHLDGQVQRAERELAELRTRRAQLGAELWGAYKPGYERHLTAPQPAGEAS